MNASILAFCLCASLGGGAPPPDRWFGEDKLKHFLASFVATSLAASAARATGLDARSSAWVGAGAGAGLGIWKEIHDRGREDATASTRDLVWDAAGVGAAVLVMTQVR